VFGLIDKVFQGEQNSGRPEGQTREQ